MTFCYSATTRRTPPSGPGRTPLCWTQPGVEGVKHQLTLVEGSTENATLVNELRGRGLDVTRPLFVGIDCSKALRKGVVDVLDHPVIQRCDCTGFGT